MQTATLVIVCCMAGLLPAADANRPVPIAGGLDNPTGVAIQPGTGDVFVAARTGIVRLAIGEDGVTKRTVEIDSFPTDRYGKGPTYNIGPLGIAFVGSGILVVGDGSQQDAEELIRIYQVNGNPRPKPIPATFSILALGPLASSGKLKAEGNYYGIAFDGRAIYATANGDDSKGWVVRSVFGADHLPQQLERFLPTKEAVGRDAPVAITVNSDGDLVIGQMGEADVPGDSLLSIYDAQTGELKASYETGLHDITGLAYTPDGTLYATDFAWLDPSQGGLYKLTVSDDACQATKRFGLDKPTALAADKDGNLYVTVFGTAENGSNIKPGQLLRITRAALGE